MAGTTTTTTQPITGPVVWTGNELELHVLNTKTGALLVGFVETITITRSVNRRPVYQIGSPIFVDAPVTQATVTVQATNMIPISPNNSLDQNVIPTGSLVAAVHATSYSLAVIAPPPPVAPGSTATPAPARVLWQVTGAFYNQDSVQVPNTDIVAYNLSWTAQDTIQWAT